MEAAEKQVGTFAIVAPPVLWSVHFLVVYIFVSYACPFGWSHGLIRLAVAVVTLVFVIALAVIWLRVWRAWRRLPPRPPGEPVAADRDRFLALCGFLMTGLFLASTVMVGVPTLLASPLC